ncbi:MAG TPA: class I SAM-dependent methyltransferase [Chloroflexota bacterium]|nr:class I SAM-dependent methyltransferase [Chloroflexota bacterium]
MERVSCCVCGSSDARDYVCTWDRSHGLPGAFRFVKCRGCGHVYLNPRPSQEEIGRYYPETYKEYLMGLEEPGAFVRWNRRYGLAKRCRVITRRRRPGRLLDVGCGAGVLMDAMRRRGWEVQGVDVTPAAVRIARERYGLDAVEGTLEGAGFPSGHFDALTLWNVIEHVPDPPATLREAARVLRPGGLIVMATPNVDALDARVFGERWALWEAPRHFNIFSPASLGLLLRASGFGNATSESVVGTWFGFATSLQYLWEERRGFRPVPGDGARPYWDTRLPMQALRALALPYTWLADRLGAGSAMVVCADRVEFDRTGHRPL